MNNNKCAQTCPAGKWWKCDLNLVCRSSASSECLQGLFVLMGYELQYFTSVCKIYGHFPSFSGIESLLWKVPVSRGKEKSVWDTCLYASLQVRILSLWLL
jgi:hypothetical protein